LSAIVASNGNRGVIDLKTSKMVKGRRNSKVASTSDHDIFSFTDCLCGDIPMNLSSDSSRSEKMTYRGDKKNSKKKNATQTEFERSLQEKSSHQKELFLKLRKLYRQADENDNNNNIDLALRQYETIRYIIKASPASGGLSAIDAKAACSMGMIYELEKNDFLKALDHYFSALDFYYSTEADLYYNVKDHGTHKKQNILDQINERICVLLFRIASVRAKQRRWKDCNQQSEEALAVLKSISQDVEVLENCKELEKRINELLELASVHLMIEDQP